MKICLGFRRQGTAQIACHLCLTLLLVVQLNSPLVVVAHFRPKVEVINTLVNSKSKLLMNSPIFYLKVANLRNNKQHHSKNPAPFASTVAGAKGSLLLGKRNSNLFKLPLQFVSNAKPVDIVRGIVGFSQVPSHKVSSFNRIYKHSKMFHLSTKYVSNGKPIKPIVLSLAKRKYYSSHRPHY